MKALHISRWCPVAVSALCAACVPLSESEPNPTDPSTTSGQDNDEGTSSVSQELTGDCTIQLECQSGVIVSCSGTQGQCAISDDGNRSTNNHYLANLSNTTVFGQADEGFFAVYDVPAPPGPNTVVCNGVPTSCPHPPSSGTATINISDYTAASGSWPRTVTMGETFMVSFTNDTIDTKDPALQLTSVSSGSIVSPDYVSLEVVGKEPGGHGGSL